MYTGAFSKRVTGLLASLICVVPASVYADGTETLGPPGIAIETGTGISIGGVGLANAPNNLEVTVPADVTIKQVLLYWSGEFSTLDDDTIDVDGIPVAGTLIGGPTLFFSNVSIDVYRADITSLGKIAPGPNSLAITNMDYDVVNSGAGILVIYDDMTSGFNEIKLADGSDLAFINFVPPLDTTVPQTYTFTAASEDRTGMFHVFAGSVGGLNRPNAIDITIGGNTTRFENPLGSLAGDFWDAFTLAINIPAGATSLTAQALSVSDGSSNLPASFNWIVGALDIPPEEVFPLACRMTGGGAHEDGTWDGTMGAGKKDRNFYTFGGQIGAPTARQPQPFGEWQHVQHRGPAGKFAFHMGTASAPPGTEIDFVECSDPGFCNPAREAPAKQLNWEGVGSFKNIGESTSATAGAIAGETLHWASGHVEDLGEPGSRNPKKNPGGVEQCPVGGSEGQIADCDCQDFYRFRIHETTDPNSAVIYEVDGYIRSGNIQLHPEIK